MSQESIIVESVSVPANEADAAKQVDAASAAAAKPAPVKLTDIRLPEDDSVDATYRGKTAAELIDMHKNAQSRIGAQGQELGTWRNLVAELSVTATKQAASTTTAQETALKVTSDELLTDPVSAISKVVRRDIESAMKPMRESQDLNAREAELRTLNADFPQMGAWGNDPGFQKWAYGARGRAADAQASVKGDTAAARRLLEGWADRVSLSGNTATTQKTDTGKGQGIEAARAATTESGGSGSAQATGKIINKSDVVDMIINKPDLYASDAYQEELKLAAKEGRLR